MKVTCEKCRKSYPYEKCNGVCPYCGRYMSMPKTVTKMESAKVDVSEKKSQKNSKWTEKQKILCTFLTGAMVIIFIIVIFDTTKQVKTNMTLREVGIIKADAAAMQEDIHIGDEVVRIQECKIMKEWNAQVPQGYQLLYIKYKTAEYSSLSFYTQVYMKLPEMAYIEPIDPYRLGDEVGIDGKVLWKDFGIDSDLEENGGLLLFLVPEELTEAELAIYCYGESDYEKEERSTKLLQKIYEIPINWEVE